MFSLVRAQVVVLFLLCVATAIPSPGQTFTPLHIFDGYDGAEPYKAALVQGTDGNLYGTAAGDGPLGVKAGTVFKITPDGTLTTIYAFCSQFGCADGLGPAAELLLSTNGNFYGTTSGGGANSAGTVFTITPDGTLTTLYSFCSQSNCSDGSAPWGSVQGTDGNFYGTAFAGGDTNNCNPPSGCGTVFQMTPAGVLKTLYTFTASGGAGAGPVAGLVLGNNGNFYGVTGCESTETVFKITRLGKLTTLHFFGGSDGRCPVAGLVLGSNGNFYGTTAIGGANSYGTVFKITPTGKLTTLHSFDSTDGANPSAGLVQATDGNLYGTAEFGGNVCDAFPGCGTIFKVTPHGKLTTLYNFCSQAGCADGALPVSALVQHTNGNFYGTTFGNDVEGGALFGTVFSESVGLGPFVEALTYSGKVGATIEFLGQGFTSSSIVSFNGTPVTPTVISGTYLTAKVPSGATTGFVTITTLSGSLQSNKRFRVLP
jgi:uncharacterized repeat protein (TIGR03803 family)